MNKILPFLLLSVLAIGCSVQSSDNQEAATDVSATIPFLERAKDMNIYEVNIRQYTPEGTISAFIPHIKRLKSMGVDILWVMPIQPIGEKNRKGPLGSYYSIQDYTAVNPEFGTMEDFKTLVKEAHALDMPVILDWVANHTAWDHAWIEKKGYHTVDSAGNIIAPVPDWSDVADLNYDNQEMQNEMIEAMRFWVKEANIDGYRCDVAGEVPMTFWNRAKDSLEIDKNVFMLAEWDEPKMHEHAFDMTYGWGFHHQMNELAKGNSTVSELIAFLEEDYKKFNPKAYRMNFTSNHDENSWNGTVKERFGEASKAYAVLAATIQGMPLLYSGMEAGLDKRLRFFKKDTIDFSTLSNAEFYKKLLTLKKENPALWNGESGARAKMQALGENGEVLGFTREKEGNTVAVLINFSASPATITLEENWTKSTTDYMTGKTINLGDTATMAPFSYYIFTNNSK